MALQRDGGIHKNLNRLISTIGGYDYRYHAGKLAEEYKLKKDDVIKVMEISETVSHNKTKGLFNMYFNRLIQGIPISAIVVEEKERTKRQYERVMRENPMASLMIDHLAKTFMENRK